MRTNPFSQDLVMLVGRIFLSLVFLVAASDKILHFGANMAYMGQHGVPFASLFLIIALLVELVGALMILLGWHARWGALIMLLFVVIVTMVFHTFWNYPPAEVANQSLHFFKNFAIIGGMLYVIACGSGRFSLDRLFYANKKITP